MPCFLESSRVEIDYCITTISLLLNIILLVCSLRVLIASPHNRHLNFDSSHFSKPGWTVMFPWQQHFASLRIARLPLTHRNKTAAVISCAQFITPLIPAQLSPIKHSQQMQSNPKKYRDFGGIKNGILTLFFLLSYESCFPPLIFLPLFAIKNILN